MQTAGERRRVQSWSQLQFHAFEENRYVSTSIYTLFMSFISVCKICVCGVGRSLERELYPDGRGASRGYSGGGYGASDNRPPPPPQR